MKDILSILFIFSSVTFLFFLIYVTIEYLITVNGLHSSLVEIRDRISKIDDPSLCDHLPNLHADIQNLKDDVVGVFGVKK